MDEMEKDFNADVYAKSVKAGKRTYFFDVKATRSGDYYLTITESKKRFENETGKFVYEKHKMFLYAEDFEKFKETLGEMTDIVNQCKNGEVTREELAERKANEKVSYLE
ncbi:MAG: DUF3276 family protein [Bacteroidales bacterium]|nr:DUF3276 family protein [Bacteroidales bacterium]